MSAQLLKVWWSTIFVAICCVTLPSTRSWADETSSRSNPQIFINSVGLKMILVKAQPFDAWTPSFADLQKAMDEVSGTVERPPIPHRVMLPADYYLAEFPVTNEIYRQFVNETMHREPSGELVDLDRIKTGKGFSGVTTVSEGAVAAWSRNVFSANDQPVTGVNHTDAVAFCKWLSRKEGRIYRLPEVYEWEYACRAGTDTLFWWGDKSDVRYMNYAASRVGHPTPVGVYPPNPWGFYDMHGNVAESCEQIGRPGGAQKGGGWNYPGSLMGSDVYVDVRGTFTPHMPITRRTLEIGFRLACDVGEASPRPGDLSAPTVVAASGLGPDIPELEITVGERIELGSIRTGQAVIFFVTRSGTWILNDKRSTDQGKTWEQCDPIYETNCQLRDGTIIATRGANSVRFPDPLDGMGTFNLKVSTDDWNTVKNIKASLHIPFGKHFGPVKGLIEMDDGSLLMTMFGHNYGDQVREHNTMFPIADQAYKTRVILVRSMDRGQRWSYLSTIFNHPEMGREGANESTLAQLPNGDLFAAMRTGIHGFIDKLGRAELDEPLFAAWSRCSGKKWAEPERIYVNSRLITGIYPESVITEEGVLALLRMRPDGSVVFSPDGSGTVWTDEVTYYTAEEASIYQGGMNDIALIAPNKLMVATFMVSKDSVGSLRKMTTAFRGIGIPITVNKVLP